MTSIHHTCRLRHLAPLAVVFATTAAQAHVSYSGRNFGSFSGGESPVSITNQNVSGSFGWADGTDDDFGDSHRLRAFRFTLNSALTFSVTVESIEYSTTSGSTTTTHIAGLLPAFSLYSGLAHLPPDQLDHDGAQISIDHLASLGGVQPKEGALRSLADWSMGNDGPELNPAFPPASLSHFSYVGHAADGSSANFGSTPGILGDGLADGSVTGTFSLPAGNYTLFVGGGDYAANVGAVAPFQTYGIRTTFAPVPEPASALLGLIGLGSVVLRRRRPH